VKDPYGSFTRSLCCARYALILHGSFTRSLCCASPTDTLPVGVSEFYHLSKSNHIPDFSQRHSQTLSTLHNKLKHHLVRLRATHKGRHRRWREQRRVGKRDEAKGPVVTQDLELVVASRCSFPSKGALVQILLPRKPLCVQTGWRSKEDGAWTRH
jgi:hypothetical protein